MAQDGGLCGHDQAPDSRKAEYVAISKFQTPFCSFLLFFTSFKLVSNSSFKLAVKGELHFSGREIEKTNAYRGSRFPVLAPGKMQFPLNSEFETGV